MGNDENIYTLPESGAPFNDVENVIYRRRSVRVYKKKQVPEYLIKRLLETARFAPSAGNGQTWKFIVIQDQEMIQEMETDIWYICRKISKLFYYLDDNSKIKSFFARLLMRMIPADTHPIPFMAAHIIAEERAGIFHGAPTIIFLLVDKRPPGDSAIEAGIAGQTLDLTAHSYGLGTCWVSFAKLLLKGKNRKKWKKRLNISYPYSLASTIAIGHPVGTPDGYVVRETKKTDWFDVNGNFKIIS
ncbi:MAG: nitroreductase family protein [Thermodesulfobacteriota bacterium]